MPVPLDLHDASVTVCLRYLARLRGLVDAAERHAQAHALAPAVLLDARLAPDMHPFAVQVAIAANFTLRACFPLAGEAIPDAGEFDATCDGLRARIDQTDALLRTLAPARFGAAPARVLQSRAGEATVALQAPEFLFQYALPNFFFHLTTAYAILRAQGVPLGKAAFDGFHVYDRPA